MKNEPITNYTFTPHALFEMKRRDLSKNIVAAILSKPEQRLKIREGRDFLQSRFELGKPPKKYLVRVFVDVESEPAEVVTVYRTSKISKYWRKNHEG